MISRRGEKRENGHIIIEGKSHHLTAGQDWISLEVGPTSSVGHRDILFALLYSDGRVWVANCIRDDDGETSQINLSWFCFFVVFVVSVVYDFCCCVCVCFSFCSCCCSCLEMSNSKIKDVTLHTSLPSNINLDVETSEEADQHRAKRKKPGGAAGNHVPHVFGLWI